MTVCRSDNTTQSKRLSLCDIYLVTTASPDDLGRRDSMSSASHNRQRREFYRKICVSDALRNAEQLSELTEANMLGWHRRARPLLRKYPANLVNFTVFTDEKVFAVARPSNTQNDRDTHVSDASRSTEQQSSRTHGSEQARSAATWRSGI